MICWNVANCFLNIGKYLDRYFNLKNSLIKDESKVSLSYSLNKWQVSKNSVFKISARNLVLHLISATPYNDVAKRNIIFLHILICFFFF